MTRRDRFSIELDDLWIKLDAACTNWRTAPERHGARRSTGFFDDPQVITNLARHNPEFALALSTLCDLDGGTSWSQIVELVERWAITHEAAE